MTSPTRHSSGPTLSPAGLREEFGRRAAEGRSRRALLPIALFFLLLLLLAAADPLLARLAVETNAAGAFLSPAGATLDAFAVAALFFLVRLTLAATFCAAAALAARTLVRRVTRRR